MNYFLLVALVVILLLAGIGTVSCPHCKSLITRGAAVCSKCGRDTKP
jgi:uncharacterized protein YjeT (DUF2065 family)